MKEESYLDYNTRTSMDKGNGQNIQQDEDNKNPETNQRKNAKVYRIVYNDALCILTALIPITIEIQQVARVYKILRGKGDHKNKLEKDLQQKLWPHPVDITKIKVLPYLL